MNEVAFTVPGIPCAWARARTRGHIHFTPKKQRAAMTFVQAVAAEAMGAKPPLDGPVRMEVDAVWPWPKSWSAKKRLKFGALWKSSRPDASNIVKLVEDAMNGVVFLDDAQVVRCQITKRYGESAATHIKIEPLAGEGWAKST